MHRMLPSLALAAFVVFGGSAADAAKGGLRTLVNLDYSHGTFDSYSITGTTASLVGSFKPGNKNIAFGGVGVDKNGLVYTAIDSSTGKPCIACFAVFKPNGTVVTMVNAPSLGSQPADITDLQLDAAGDVYLSDMGQQAAYYYSPSGTSFSGPTIVETGTNPSTIAVSENAQLVYISGSCGFGAVLTYTLQSSGSYTPGSCFSIAEIALIGGVADDQGDVITPVDGAPGIVAVSNAAGNGNLIKIPGKLAPVGSVALSGDGTTLYVADAKNQSVIAFARPSGGWTTGQPKIVAKYTGFKHLNIIAVPL